ncbi:hypothetical protein IM774_09870 [Erysipelotrichaceae bacterium RD49]|nr:hypothetical protein [Erysipelotrichaceae bacterium RD49]
MKFVNERLPRKWTAKIMDAVLILVSTLLCTFAAYCIIYGTAVYIGILVLAAVIAVWGMVMYVSLQNRPSAIDTAVKSVGQVRMKMDGFASMNGNPYEKMQLMLCEKGIILRMESRKETAYAFYKDMAWQTMKNDHILALSIRGGGWLDMKCNNPVKVRLFVKMLEAKGVKQMESLQSA